MKKYLISIFIIALVFAGLAWTQGSYLTELTEDTSPTSDDLVYMVNDPSGTPGDRKVTKTNLLGTQVKGFVINAATTTDDFLVWKTPTNITITNIYGVLLSGTNVVGGFDECDSAGINCTPIDADITFDGGQDADDGSLSNASVDANDWIKWHTTTVSSPGYLSVVIWYKDNS